MNRSYDSAEMQPGKPQSVSHLVIEHTSTYWILFGIPGVDARANIVEFRPDATTEPSRALALNPAAQGR